MDRLKVIEECNKLVEDICSAEEKGLILKVSELLDKLALNCKDLGDTKYLEYLMQNGPKGFGLYDLARSYKQVIENRPPNNIPMPTTADEVKKLIIEKEPGTELDNFLFAWLELNDLKHSPVQQGLDVLFGYKINHPMGQNPSTDSSIEKQTKEQRQKFEDELKEKSLSEIFTFDKQLGSGSYGMVVLATRKEHPEEHYKVKILFEHEGLKSNGSSRSKIEKEVKVCKKISPHPNIVYFHGSFIGEADDKLYAVANTSEQLRLDELKLKYTHPRHHFYFYDYYPQTLEKFLADCKNDLSFSTILSYSMQLVDALCHCEKHSVVHLDLKTNNILLSEDKQKIVLIDFGLSNDQKDLLLTAVPGMDLFLGNHEHMAPEILNTLYQVEKHYDGPKTISLQKQHSFATGVLFFEIATKGKKPFFKYPRNYKKNDKIIFDSENIAKIEINMDIYKKNIVVLGDTSDTHHLEKLKRRFLSLIEKYSLLVSSMVLMDPQERPKLEDDKKTLEELKNNYDTLNEEFKKIFPNLNSNLDEIFVKHIGTK